ncbi:MAG TPA: UDP-N-acetylmuramoyl-L-alanyl-D-glutamate--2,6-diaminopimelate ligase [Methylomusa anaerophila]|uniref:UDP-N-acetylmuramoyl-L-alanyl-D-glutamate--2,6-diaminopimelate ligase n=1 Tax=Methylomusa anaerophila TaxID=1930071 RepID=A0A348AQB8_9FIRM|nr:UDP-N-acetylmuramoyl-L-alanyl-D-glutamate--2,6-diaminopimelate ligase [Methylomusa anaerophila]BBB93266.1 UDP-N-acetylmuramoyl-L-alanyl-D-glutamate--2,6-diaminopimelate ligase [Methylomusa anaerophila]HML86902.1 UDP-N-acetylmuramoyl-L-alanyl-D-glutamate--2,6-diaminopimelate ligase [Methylomusa anaerophila]
MSKQLQKLIELLPDVTVTGSPDRIIESITYDSRRVTPGALFICLTGNKVDGHNYIIDAYDKGAVAVLVEKNFPQTIEGLTVIKVASTRAAMQQIAPYFFDYPGRKLRIIGITGTNGKTTTTYLIRQILMQAGYKVGLIGTIQTIIGEQVLPVKNTTPDVIDLQSILADMVTQGMDYAVMEVSSHALALNRVAGCEFDVGVFTNITQDHLDFHENFDNYIEAKAKLFRSLGSPDSSKYRKTAVINLDDAAGEIMLKSTACSVISYGVEHPAELMAREIKVKANGASFEIAGSHGRIPLNLKITGMFNVYNVLGAIGAAVAEGIDKAIIMPALESFESVPGRFELVQAGQPYTVIVDYAHTPDGLENVLKTAKQFARNKVLVVFGCGGDRDRTKRPIMGKTAVKYADIIIATSDNPRTENPEDILKDVEVGIKEAMASFGDTKQYEIIVDRRQAIQYALKLAREQDIILIAGKGHETYQILKDRTIDFDDREIAREIIGEMR